MPKKKESSVVIEVVSCENCMFSMSHVWPMYYECDHPYRNEDIKIDKYYPGSGVPDKCPLKGSKTTILTKEDSNGC